jgi:hypothetical protein
MNFHLPARLPGYVAAVVLSPAAVALAAESPAGKQVVEDRKSVV